MQGLETLAKRYATAVYSLAIEAGPKAVTDVGAQLHAIHDAIESDGDVTRFFLSPVIDGAVKERLLGGVFAGKVGDIALHTLLLLVRKRREALLGALVRGYDALVLAASGRETLEIVSARPLAATEVDDIARRLSARYGKSFLTTQRVDPALLGGVRITVGDRLIDGSLAGRIDDLARDLLSATV